MAIIACVLKSGGDYTAEHVLTLKAMCRRVMPTMGAFVCLTDLRIPNVHTIPLMKGWPGWWSKIELFRPGVFGDQECVMYLDLDTVILEKFALTPSQGEFWMLKDFYKSEHASGMMCWRGDFSFLFNRMPSKPDPQSWDQRYIYAELMAAGVVPKIIQNHVKAVSYKKHCNKGRGPRDAQVVCFHGKPRPWQVDDPWVKEAYHAGA